MATGGYRADFDPPLPEKYRCGACLLAVREAHETPVSYDPVCGHLFCASCAAWILDKPEDERVCPADGTPIKSAKPTPYIDRKLVVLKVRCPNARFGCPDMMALSELEGHAVGRERARVARAQLRRARVVVLVLVVSVLVFVLLLVLVVLLVVLLL